MINSKAIAIITARGGSKRIPRKNIKDFLGRPILLYTIEAALQARCFDEVMVSTEDQEIAQLAQKAGAKVPFLRSPTTSDDHATTAEVLLEVLAAYGAEGREFNYFCGLYPTAPFITSSKLDEAFEQLIKSGATSLVPVVRYGFPIHRSFKQERGRLILNWPEYLNTRSQDLPETYHDAGQFYFAKTAIFLRDKKIFTDFSIPYVIPESEVQDIDTLEDWRMAEIKYTFYLEQIKLSNSGKKGGSIIN